MERSDFLEQPRLLVARGRLRSPRGEAFATRRRGGGAPGSVRASRIDFSLLRSTLQRAEEAHENSGRPLGHVAEIAATLSTPSLRRTVARSEKEADESIPAPKGRESRPHGGGD